jgi:hypothetical protein
MKIGPFTTLSDTNGRFARMHNVQEEHNLMTTEGIRLCHDS